MRRVEFGRSGRSQAADWAEMQFTKAEESDGVVIRFPGAED